MCWICVFGLIILHGQENSLHVRSLTFVGALIGRKMYFHGMNTENLFLFFFLFISFSLFLKIIITE